MCVFTVAHMFRPRRSLSGKGGKKYKRKAVGAYFKEISFLQTFVIIHRLHKISITFLEII